MKATQLITLLLVLFTGIGVASAKPKVAVLGLEVLDKTNVKPSVDAARQLTEGLRAAANAAGGPFEVAPNSQREFLDEKIINQCEKEERDCLLKIAGNFGATSLIYGKIQLGDNKKNFQVQVFLLSSDKGPAKPSITSVPVAATAQELAAAGKKIYNDLVGVTSVGSIVIKAKSSRGTVFINNEQRGQLVDGELKATQLADGEYRVRIQADGFKKWEETVKVKAGQITTIEAKLEAEAVAKPPVPEDPEEDDKARPIGPEKDPFKLDSRENTVSKGGSRTGWKIAAVGGVVVAAGSMGFWALQRRDREDSIGNLAAAKALNMGISYDASPTFGTGCGGDNHVRFPTGYATGDEDSLRGDFRNACTNVRNMWLAGTVAGLAGAVAVFSFYKGFIQSSPEESSSTAATKRKSRKSRFALTPVVSPEGGGATVRIDF